MLRIKDLQGGDLYVELEECHGRIVNGAGKTEYVPAQKFEVLLLASGTPFLRELLLQPTDYYYHRR